jgi:hypothetical protein
MAFRRELCLPYDLLLRFPPNKEQSMTDYEADFVDQLRGIHFYSCQHLKVSSDKMKACYDYLTNSMGFQEGDQVWLYCPMTRGKSSKLQPS